MDTLSPEEYQSALTALRFMMQNYMERTEELTTEVRLLRNGLEGQQTPSPSGKRTLDLALNFYLDNAGSDPRLGQVEAIKAMQVKLWPQRYVKGGEGSGNHGHAGRPGEVGGSGSGGGRATRESSSRIEETKRRLGEAKANYEGVAADVRRAKKETGHVDPRLLEKEKKLRIAYEEEQTRLQNQSAPLPSLPNRTKEDVEVEIQQHKRSIQSNNTELAKEVRSFQNARTDVDAKKYERYIQIRKSKIAAIEKNMEVLQKEYEQFADKGN